jgi:ribosomal protein S18 acetylase RimI-like enzyme
MLRIRNFSADTFQYVANLYATEDWGYLSSDIKRYMEWEPDGCFVAKIDDKYVGHVFSVSYDHLGWIGLLRVDPNFRKRGIGSELMKQAISYLHDTGVKVIKLEAVQNAVNLYRRLGFKEEFDSLRFRVVVQNLSVMEHTFSMNSSERVEIRPMKNKDILSIAELDSLYFRAPRTKVLRTLFQEFPHLCFVADTGNTLIGYVMCRKSTSGTYKIGPWVSDPEEPKVAGRLLITCLRKLGENNVLALGIPVINEQAISILKKFGFQHASTCKRMYLGQIPVKDNPKGIFAIGGSEKG